MLIYHSRKRCKVCHQPKYLIEFPKQSGYVDSHSNVCKECALVRNRKRRQKAIHDPDQKLKAQRAVEGMKYRAKEKGVPFDENYFTVDRVYDMLSNAKNCACCSRALDFSGKNKKLMASFDKVVPSLGYTKGNVAIICFECNSRKLDSTADDLRMIARYIDAWLA